MVCMKILIYIISSFIHSFIARRNFRPFYYICISYHNGNDQNEGQLRGFGHIGFLVNDLDAACARLEAHGVAFKKKPTDGLMRGLL